VTTEFPSQAYVLMIRRMPHRPDMISEGNFASGSRVNSAKIFIPQ
jgi:hypothetical protein